MESMYNNFDAEAIITSMRQKAGTSMTTDQMTADMHMMGIAYLIRGTNLDKILRRSKDETVQFLQSCIDKYGLTGTGFGRQMDKNVVTLNRIAIIEAFYLANVVVNVDKDIRVPPSDLLKREGVTIPPIFKVSTIASILPTDDALLYNAFIALLKVWNRIINPRADKQESVRRLERNQQIGHTSSDWSNEKRKKMMRDLKVYKEDNTRTEQYSDSVLTSFSEVCARILLSMGSDGHQRRPPLDVDSEMSLAMEGLNLSFNIPSWYVRPATATREYPSSDDDYYEDEDY